MNKKEFNDGLLKFLDESPTPFHATSNMAIMLEKNEFIRLNEENKWNLECGKKYFVTRNDSSIIAFTYPHKNKKYTMIGAHTDSPNLKLKPNPVIKDHNIVKLGVEPYGGLLLNTWFDRDLSLAGRVSYKDNHGKLNSTLINIKESIAIIPSLAIHLDRKANSDKSINAQTDISPILTTNQDFNLNTFLIKDLLSKGITNAEDICAFELSLYDNQKASFTGLDKDFIASARLDNLLSCYIGLMSMCNADILEPRLFIANDHEEVGSNSTSGASGSFLENTLRRVFKDYDEYMQIIRTSLMVSADNAHAIHPNFSSKHDPQHTPYINKGVVVKINSNQKYASNSITISQFVNAASKIKEPLQYFTARNDMGCGSTIGPITATRIGIETIDVGIPTFAMHSIRELCGSDDPYSMYKIILEI